MVQSLSVQSSKWTAIPFHKFSYLEVNKTWASLFWVFFSFLAVSIKGIQPQQCRIIPLTYGNSEHLLTHYPYLTINLWPNCFIIYLYNSTCFCVNWRYQYVTVTNQCLPSFEVKIYIQQNVQTLSTYLPSFPKHIYMCHSNLYQHKDRYNHQRKFLHPLRSPLFWFFT